MKAPSLGELRPAAGIEKSPSADIPASPGTALAIIAVLLLTGLTAAMLALIWNRHGKRLARRELDLEYRLCRLSAITEPTSRDWLKLDMIVRDLVRNRLLLPTSSMSADEIIKALPANSQQEGLCLILMNAEKIQYSGGLVQKGSTHTWEHSLNSVRMLVVSND